MGRGGGGRRGAGRRRPPAWGREEEAGCFLRFCSVASRFWEFLTVGFGTKQTWNSDAHWGLSRSRCTHHPAHRCCTSISVWPQVPPDTRLCCLLPIQQSPCFRPSDGLTAVAAPHPPGPTMHLL